MESIKRSAQAPFSLEKPVGDEEESEFGQFIADERAESPYERAAEILTKEALREALENLSYRERRVLELRLRWGKGGRELPEHLGVAMERVARLDPRVVGRQRRPGGGGHGRNATRGTTPRTGATTLYLRRRFLRLWRNR